MILPLKWVADAVGVAEDSVAGGAGTAGVIGVASAILKTGEARERAVEEQQRPVLAVSVSKVVSAWVRAYCVRFLLALELANHEHDIAIFNYVEDDLWLQGSGDGEIQWRRSAATALRFGLGRTARFGRGRHVG